MITEDYVSFETAKLLKEKGFDEDTEHEIWYVIKQFSTGCHWNYCTYKVGDITREYDDNCCISMPTLQMVMKWLREVYHIFIDIDYDIRLGTKPYFTLITDMNKWDYFKGNDLPTEKETYEEACEAAIKYCLENLI